MPIGKVCTNGRYIRKNRKKNYYSQKSKAKQEGLSQEKLAYIADVDRTYMTGIETGKRNVSVVVLAKIVKALDTDLASFFNDESFRDGK